MQKIKISGIVPGSIAEELGIEAGDMLTSINDSEIRDIFDYRFFTADSELTLEIEKPDSEIWRFDIEKDEMEDLGLEFPQSLIDEEKSCRNKCVFCFIDQLPKGMRESLYFKDDDARLSFLFGNYITMTNLDDTEIDRIIRYRMSPVNISVHATNPELRRRMLNNRFAGDVLDKIKRFVQGEITVNCQIVVCPGLNDGEELDRTIGDLTAFSPYMHSISVVPVGLTRFRDNLVKLEPFNEESAHKVVRQVEAWQEKLLRTTGSRIVYLADELYLMARRPIPPYEAYEDFPQIENGVGMVASFASEVSSALHEARPEKTGCRTISIATGTSFAPILSKLAGDIEGKFGHVRLKVYPVINHFFGEGVTVTGLLTGSDIMAQLKGQELGDELFLSRNMFRAGTEMLLDDYTLQEIEKCLNVTVRIMDNDGQSFVDAVYG
jgi:putative radical SAM enzyme (TIGR03279 family)